MFMETTDKGSKDMRKNDIIYHPEPRRRVQESETPKEKGNNSQEYEKSKYLVNTFDGPHRNKGEEGHRG